MSAPVQPPAKFTHPEMGKEESMARMVIRRFFRHKAAVVGAFILIFLAIGALLAPLIWGDIYNTIPSGDILAQSKQPPSLGHPMGTDDLGRDMLARIFYGGRVSLTVGVVSALISITIGGVIGAVSGYYGGAIDNVLQRFVELISTLPFFFMVLVMVAVFGNSFWNVIMVLGVLGWTGTARLVRGQFLQLRSLEFVQAAKALGAPDGRIMMRHIFPNTMAVVIVSATLGVADNILVESALSFFGIGVPTTTPTWGNMLTNAQQYLYRAPWLAVFPGIMILLTVMSFNFLGDGLRDALDPRLKQ